MKYGALISLLLVATLLGSQSGCFTLLAVGAATDTPMGTGGGGAEAACVLALEFLLWPVLIGDVLIASIICLATLEKEPAPPPEPPAESPE